MTSEPRQPQFGPRGAGREISPNGRDLVYATVLSASGFSEQWASGIAVDAAGAAYVTGLLNSSFNNAECGCFTDFPTTPGAYQRDIPPHYEPADEGALIVGPQLFALKLDPTGPRSSTRPCSAAAGGRMPAGLLWARPGRPMSPAQHIPRTSRRRPGTRPARTRRLRRAVQRRRVPAARVAAGSGIKHRLRGGSGYQRRRRVPRGQTASRDLPVTNDLQRHGAGLSSSSATLRSCRGPVSRPNS